MYNNTNLNIRKLKDKSIDIIFICDAFHEFNNRKKTISELYMILKPGGNFAILEDSKKYTARAQKMIEEAGLFKFVEKDNKFLKYRK